MSWQRPVMSAFQASERNTEGMTPSEPEPSWLHLGLSEGGKN